MLEWRFAADLGLAESPVGLYERREYRRLVQRRRIQHRHLRSGGYTGHRKKKRTLYQIIDTSQRLSATTP